LRLPQDVRVSGEPPELSEYGDGAGAYARRYDDARRRDDFEGRAQALWGLVASGAESHRWCLDSLEHDDLERVEDAAGVLSWTGPPPGAVARLTARAAELPDGPARDAVVGALPADVVRHALADEDAAAARSGPGGELLAGARDPFTETIWFVRAPYADVLRARIEWTVEGGTRETHSERRGSLLALLDLLEPAAIPSWKWLIVEAGPEWTAIFSQGSDLSFAAHFAERLRTQVARAPGGAGEPRRLRLELAPERRAAELRGARALRRAADRPPLRPRHAEPLLPGSGDRVRPAGVLRAAGDARRGGHERLAEAAGGHAERRVTRSRFARATASVSPAWRVLAPMPRTRIALILAVMAASLVAAQPASASHGCSKHAKGGKITHKSKEAHVFEKNDRWYGCAAKVGRPYLLPGLDRVSEGKGGDGTVPVNVQLAGVFVAYERYTIYPAGGAGDTQTDIYVVDLRNGKVVVDQDARAPSGQVEDYDVADLVLKRNGSIGWITEHTTFAQYPATTNYEVYRFSRERATAGRALLDSGADIVRDSLTLSADRRTLLWTKGTEARSAPLS
jgi:hypothetical protein